MTTPRAGLGENQLRYLMKHSKPFRDAVRAVRRADANAARARRIALGDRLSGTGDESAMQAGLEAELP